MEQARKHLLLVASTTGYQTRAFAEAAERLGFQLTLATDRCHVLDDPWGDRAIALRFEDPASAAEAIAREAASDVAGVVAVGDRPAYLAALAAERLGLRYHPSAAVEASRNKYLARERFRAAGLLVPQYARVALDADPLSAAEAAKYPCVLKPLGLSASRGVIRANNTAEFRAAFARIRALLASPDIARLRDRQDRFLQVEDFIEGREFALEGLVTGGRLRVLALFDKPDPLDGPFFEETIYTTPSRENPATQAAIVETTQRAIEALGFTDGPVHAEMRVNKNGVWMLEAAARPIGGLCARTLRFASVDTGNNAAGPQRFPPSGSTSRAVPYSVDAAHNLAGREDFFSPESASGAARSAVDAAHNAAEREHFLLSPSESGAVHLSDVRLEELILRHAAGEEIGPLTPARPASGVMMIPIPRAGVYTSVAGVAAAEAIPGVESIEITAKEGQMLVPLPEGASYLGFLFAHGDTPAHVETSLRAAHAKLEFQITTSLPVL